MIKLLSAVAEIGMLGSLPFVLVVVVQGIEPRALHMVGRCSVAEVHLSQFPLCFTEM